MAAVLYERLKKSRKAARAAFTRDLTAFLEEIRQEEPNHEDVLVTFQILEARSQELDGLNKKICEKLVEITADREDHEKAMQDEYDVAAEYSSKYLRAKIEVAKLNHNALQQGQPTFQQQTAATDNTDSQRRFKLPKIELQKFNGDLKDWLQFWSQFKNIHKDTSITKEDKFQYLIQAMVPKSRAADLVNSFPPTSNNYDKVIDSLQSRFGKEELLVEVYVRELLSLVINNAVKSNEKMALSSIYDKLEAQLRALESLGVAKDKCAAMLYPLVESSLPEEVIRAWQRQATMNKSKTVEERLNKLIEFLQEEVENEERLRMAVKGFNLNNDKSSNKVSHEKAGKKKNRSSNNDIPTATGLLATKSDKDSNQNNKNYLCIFCNEGHRSTRCEKAKKMSIDEKWNRVKEKSCCFNCLVPGHSSKVCKFNTKCQWCGKKHSILLCREMLPKDNLTKEAPVEDREKCNEEATLANVSPTPEVFLQTLRVILRNGDKEHVVRVIMDSGSQRSYILKRAAEKIGYKPSCEHQVIHLLFGGTKTTPQDHKGYLIHLKSLDNNYACNFVALDQETICQGISSINNGPWVQELMRKNIKLTDVGQNTEPITILIGSDVMGKLITGKVHNLECGMTAMETRLGWTLMGKKPGTMNIRNDTALVVTTMFVQDADITKLWSLDVLGIRDPVETKSKEQSQQEVCNRFRQTVIVNKDRRYEVCLPWKESHPSLETNKQLAQKRLQVTTEKLKQQGLYEEYEQVLEEWLEEGIIEKVPAEEKNMWGHYLPHRHVLKDNSTTRLRPVFDASAKCMNGVSLNQCLEPGPNLIELIPTILLRFREKEIGVIADIRKAFLQISITPKDRNALRFLWWNKTSPGVIEIYRHTRVVFGVTSSPFLLAAVIELLLEQAAYTHQFQHMNDTIQKLLKSFYVDNCVTSLDSEEQLQQFKDESTILMASGGFDLRGWEYSQYEEPHQLTSVLGLTWDKKEDVLMLKHTSLIESTNEKITKRVILAASHKVFDPIGFVCPVLLYPKLLLQTINSLEWDTEVPEDVREQFEEWHQQLELLKEVKIPRWVFSSCTEESRSSFHVFVDASRVAYAAVIYGRTQSSSGVKIQLISAKSRVAPNKKVTIPRLELLAATTGARLMQSVLEALEYENQKIYYWSDSTTVLTWIHRQSQWAVFVWNRVQEIRKLTEATSWRYVPGNMNPADMPSRGCTSKQLVESKWWEGPQWLYHDPENWPTSEYFVDNDEVNSELKKSARKITEENTILSNICQDNDETSDGWYYRYFSQYAKLIRMVGWIKRFIYNAQKKARFRRCGELSAKEFSAVETDVLRLSQKESFSGEHDERIKGLRAYIDKSNLIRIKTLISNRCDDINFREPIVLSPRHPIVPRLIRHYHDKLQHAGVQTVLNEMREKFWILQGRKTIRMVVNKCIICKRYKSTPADAAPSALPENRVREAVVFEVTGVDFAGPVFLKENQKAWICLFTCAIYRAVHLELVTSLSTEAFLEALRRFIARRGRPSTIYSDNGTNFIGASNCLRRLNWSKIERYSSVEKIEWHFNPPSAAWWGGWWERLVRVMKELLRKVLKKSSLTYEEMSTTLCDCESIINSRPITYLSDNAYEPRPLTPAMFLHEAKSNGIPDLDHIDTIDLKKRVKYRQRLREDLRRRFRSEYLGQLSRKQLRLDGKPVIQVGEIVLVGNDNQKRLDWPLAKVIETIPGKDGVIRVVRLKTATGELVRPVQRIYQLEISSPHERQTICEVSKQECDNNETLKTDSVAITSPKGSESDNHIETVVPKVVTRYGREVKPPKKYGVNN